MQLALAILLLLCTNGFSFNSRGKIIEKRALQKAHEKPQWQKWADVFFGKPLFDQVQSLIELLTKISLEYLSECTPIILYDVYTEKYDNLLLQKLLNNYPLAYIHGQITENYTIKAKNVIKNQKTCINYILFIKDVMRCKEVIGEQSFNKVVIVARSTQWRVFEFLSHERSQSFTNLLVIAKSEKIVSAIEELPYILYTHKLYVDALGSNKPQILTSWFNGSLARPHVHLFPRKMTEGFAGHRFIISFAHQPPFVIKRGRDVDGDYMYDGIEMRLINMLSKIYNFTTDFREAAEYDVIGSAEAVFNMVRKEKANLGVAGAYITEEKAENVGQWHSQDCAAFISLTSTALPRYRAIMGPFHWTVWVTITFIYLFAILPLVFSDKHTLRPLMKNPEQVEDMFWYVFGTFTNCFTFGGRQSWSKSDRITTRLLIGFYWIFTIIITACYTGSIIAFVTLPVFPAVVDTVNQLLNGHYQIGTLDKGGWQYWYENSSDPNTAKLLKNIELVSDVESGLKNTTTAFFWSYAFLGSRAQLDFIVRTNFSTSNKRSLLHITKDCFVPYSIGILYPKNSIYKEILNKGVLHAVESGFLLKLKNDVEWLIMRSATGKLLSANAATGGLKALSVEDRALTLDDTQGMFLLLGIGFLMGGVSLLSEWFGGCLNLFKRKRSNSTISIASNPRSHEGQTPRQKLDSIEYSYSLKNHRLGSIVDMEFDTEHNHVPIENHADLIVHASKNDGEIENEDSDTDYEEEINKLFECVFGEENIEESSVNKEELLDDLVENNTNSTMKE